MLCVGELVYAKKGINISLIGTYLSLSINCVWQVEVLSSTMLSILWGGSASSSKYTPLSDSEGSPVPPNNGISLRFFIFDFHVSYLLGKPDGGPAKIPICSVPSMFLCAREPGHFPNLTMVLWTFLVQWLLFSFAHDFSLDVCFIDELILQSFASMLNS